MKRTIVFLTILLPAVVPAGARRSTAGPAELALHPAKVSEQTQECRLLPKANEQTDADAVPLYQQAIQSLPDEYPRKKFGEWRTMRPNELPAAQVKSELEKLKPTLDLVTQAARCKLCNWPSVTPGQVSQQHMDDLSKYRELAFILEVQVKIQIAQGQYEQAIETLKTLFAMAKHLGDAPTLVQGMVGISIGALSLKEVEQFIQSADSPSLYWALQDLKLPLVDLTKTMDLEIANLKNYNFILRRQFRKQLEPAHDRIRVQMNYLDRTATALQCIEALRLHAGAHEGKFPDNLSNITEFSIPDDPVTNKPLAYSRTGPEAVIELQGTEGSDGRNAIKYVLTLKE
ncbi:MAG: hypothetical protein ABIF19_19165 [Planctomycetota bacterium]